MVQTELRGLLVNVGKKQAFWKSRGSWAYSISMKARQRKRKYLRMRHRLTEEIAQKG